MNQIQMMIQRMNSGDDSSLKVHGLQWFFGSYLVALQQVVLKGMEKVVQQRLMQVG